MTVQVAPTKSYEYELYYNQMLTRWFAKFTSTKDASYSYDFPLADAGWYEPSTMSSWTRESGKLSSQEEATLSLIFSQMISVMQIAAARRAIESSKPTGSTEGVLGS